MNFAGLFFLLVCHFLSGRAVIRLFKLELDPIPAVCLSFIIGVPLISFAPCALQLMGMPITESNIFISVGIFTAIYCLSFIKDFTAPRFPKIGMPKLYELPFLLVVLGFIIISLWRCYYMPPYSRDMLSGPELVAEYAVREKTMINSVFNVDLSTSNNYFKSPYVTTLQIIYKLLVYPFGQLWLSVLFLSFIIWIITLVRSRIHPFIAGFLLLFFIAIPELFAYSFVILYDYSNMVFFFSGFYFLSRYVINDRIRDLAFSTLLFGLATYIRTESLILIAMMTPLLMWHFYGKKVPLKVSALRISVFMLVPFAFFYLCIKIFVHKFVPLPLNVTGEINHDLGNLSYLSQRLGDMAGLLIFSETGTEFYGMFFIFFVIIFCMDLVFIRRFNKEAAIALYGVLVIYFGLGFIGYLLPLADLSNTTKRGLFKALPVALIYLTNSGVLQKLGGFLQNWEFPPAVKPKPVVARPIPVRPAAKSQKPPKGKR